MGGDHRDFPVIRVRAGGDARCIRTGESLDGSVEDGGDRLLEGFAVVSPSGPVWIWVSRGG